MTFAEFVEYVKGYSRKNRQRINELIYLAWHIEAFHRERGRLPSLESLLIQDEIEPKQMTDDQMMAMARVLNAAYGGAEV